MGIFKIIAVGLMTGFILQGVAKQPPGGISNVVRDVARLIPDNQELISSKINTTHLAVHQSPIFTVDTAVLEHPAPTKESSLASTKQSPVSGPKAYYAAPQKRTSDPITAPQKHTTDLITAASMANQDLANVDPANQDLSTPLRIASPDLPVVENRSPVYGRITYAVVSLISLCTLSGLMATRIRKLRILDWRSMNLIRFLTTMIYCLGIGFIFSAGILMDGSDLTNDRLCRGAIYLCLVFYIGCKVTIYVFLVERAHMLRLMRRLADKVFLIGIFILVCGFGPIAILAFKVPVASVSKVDGKCRIGLPLPVTIPLLTYDVLINVGMMAMYIWLALPYLGGRSFPGIKLRALGFRRNNIEFQSQGELLELFIWKGLYGAFVVILPTVANLVTLFRVHGREQGWLCFTICTIDVSWSVIIIHWLTSTPQELDDFYARMAQRPEAPENFELAGMSY